MGTSSEIARLPASRGRSGSSRRRRGRAVFAAAALVAGACVDVKRADEPTADIGIDSIPVDAPGPDAAPEVGGPGPDGAAQDAGGDGTKPIDDVGGDSDSGDSGGGDADGDSPDTLEDDTPDGGSPDGVSPDADLPDGGGEPLVLRHGALGDGGGRSCDPTGHCLRSLLGVPRVSGRSEAGGLVLFSRSSPGGAPP